MTSVVERSAEYVSVVRWFGSRRRPGAFWAAVGLAVVAVLGAVGTADAGHPLRALAVAALAPVLVAIGTFIANR